MNINSHYKTAKTNLRSGKVRTLLAILGILVGTASVVALLSTGNLATEAALEQFNTLGTNLMSINLVQESGTGGYKPPAQRVTKLFTSLESEIPGITSVAPYLSTSAQMSFEKSYLNSSIIGTTQNLGPILGLKMQSGRFINKLDKLNLFCVLGHDVVKTQLGKSSAIGKQIKIGKVIFTIVGVLNRFTENAFLQADLNNSIIVSLDTLSFFSENSSPDSVVMKLNPNADIEQIKEKVNSYFTKNLPGYKPVIQSAKELLKSMAAQRDIFTLLLAGIGGISLLVGGIGVMNIMLASVAERRQEIGLRLALGAEPKDIQWMFLTEAVMLAVIGGGAGVVVGIFATWLVSHFAGWTFKLYLMPPVIGFTTSVLICIFFGFYPSYRASKLNPIETLRGE